MLRFAGMKRVALIVCALSLLIGCDLSSLSSLLNGIDENTPASKTFVNNGGVPDAGASVPEIGEPVSVRIINQSTSAAQVLTLFRVGDVEVRRTRLAVQPLRTIDAIGPDLATLLEISGRRVDGTPTPTVTLELGTGFERDAVVDYIITDPDDACPDDPAKTSPGFCGCGVQEIDTDEDGVPDCVDGCPRDPNKIAPGSCGCGFVEKDVNNNGIADCLEQQTTTKPSPDNGGGQIQLPTIYVTPDNLYPTVEQGSNASSQHFTVSNSGGGTLEYSITINGGQILTFTDTSVQKDIRISAVEYPTAWLSVDPTGGQSTGEGDVIAVHYATAGLYVGTYEADIVVSDPNSTNGSVAVHVTLAITQSEPVGACCFGVQGCEMLTASECRSRQGKPRGPGTYCTPYTCAPVIADYNEDGDVDGDDFIIYYSCYNGPTTIVSEDCLFTDFNNDQHVDASDFDIFSACFNGPQLDPRCDLYKPL